jgi:hypothetical protein
MARDGPDLPSCKDIRRGPMKNIALLAALCAGTVACGSSTPSANCQSACQKIMSCTATGGYGYGFGYSGTAYPSTFGYGVYGYAPNLTLSQCVSGCQALAAADQNRVITCISNGSTCSAELSCD